MRTTTTEPNCQWQSLDVTDHPARHISKQALLWVVMGHWDSLVKGNIINQSRQADIQHSRPFQRGNHSRSGFFLILSLVCIGAQQTHWSLSFNSHYLHVVVTTKAQIYPTYEMLKNIFFINFRQHHCNPAVQSWFTWLRESLMMRTQHDTDKRKYSQVHKGVFLFKIIFGLFNFI